MGIVAWLIMGLIAGIVARTILPGKAPGGWVWTIGLGIVGALVGGFLGTQLGFGDVHGFDLRSIILAIGGALLCLVVYDRFIKK
ncbi:MAG: GlsB/YeaQ/YmgE family stress response membrane protein [Gemmataceae bacterium]